MTIFWRILLLLFVVIGSRSIGDRVASENGFAEIDEVEEEALGDDFAYDVAARFNESLIASNDLTGNVLMAILAGSVAVDVFAIDKIRELAGITEWIALVMLGCSAAACMFGYALSFPWTKAFDIRDGTRPERFISDFADNPGAATVRAIVELTKSGEANLRIRRVKKMYAIVALTLLVAGAVVVALARLSGKVVLSQ
jgi:hypothetical protein